MFKQILIRNFCSNTGNDKTTIEMNKEKLQSIINFLISHKANLESKLAEEEKSLAVIEELINYTKTHNDLKEDEIVDLISKKLNRNIGSILKKLNVSDDSRFSSKLDDRSSWNEELKKRLISMREKLEHRIHLDLEPEVFNPDYARGFYFSFDRWNYIKTFKLYKDLSKVQEEIEEKIDILEWLIKEEGDASLLELQSIKDFIDTLEEDQNYFLSSKTIRKFDRHPQLHKKRSDFWKI